MRNAECEMRKGREIQSLSHRGIESMRGMGPQISQIAQMLGMLNSEC